jgi:hypothetical protein
MTLKKMTLKLLANPPSIHRDGGGREWQAGCRMGPGGGPHGGQRMGAVTKLPYARWPRRSGCREGRLGGVRNSAPKSRGASPASLGCRKLAWPFRPVGCARPSRAQSGHPQTLSHKVPSRHVVSCGQDCENLARKEQKTPQNAGQGPPRRDRVSLAWHKTLNVDLYLGTTDHGDGSLRATGMAPPHGAGR